MSRRVYIIDEEIMFSEELASSLRMAGYDAIHLVSAGAAIVEFEKRRLRNSSDVFYIDMWLLAGNVPANFFNGETSEEKETEMFIGLSLVEYMLKRGHIPRSKCANVILYTAHDIDSLWARMKKMKDEHGMKNLEKRADYSLDDYLSLIR